MSNNKQSSVKYVATIKTSHQISQDEWKVINPSMLCDENTTVSDIEIFCRKHIGSEKHIEVKLIKLE